MYVIHNLYNVIESHNCVLQWNDVSGAYTTTLYVVSSWVQLTVQGEGYTALTIEAVHLAAVLPRLTAVTVGAHKYDHLVESDNRALKWS